MTTITATIQGDPEDLKDASVCAVHFASQQRLAGNRLTVRYVCETEDYEAALSQVTDDIDLERLELCGCELVSLA